VGVFANPILPQLTDSVTNLESVAAAAAKAGAQYFGGGTLFLMPSAQQQFFPFLDREFPELAARYRKRYLRQPYLRGDYQRWIGSRLRKIRARFGLADAPVPYQPEECNPDNGGNAQLPLFS
jgi:DNA repair photolyase